MIEIQNRPAFCLPNTKAVTIGTKDSALFLRTSWLVQKTLSQLSQLSRYYKSSGNKANTKFINDKLMDN
jgi:hypothetical protein